MTSQSVSKTMTRLKCLDSNYKWKNFIATLKEKNYAEAKGQSNLSLKGNLQMEGHGYHQNKGLGGNADKIGTSS